MESILCLALLFLPASSIGGTWTLLPALGVSGQYEDNVYFTATDKVSDYSSIVAPSLNIDYYTERSKLRGSGDLQIINYTDERDLNTVNQNFRLNGDTRITERWLTDVKLRYVKDTLFDSQLLETGQIYGAGREDRKRYDAGVGTRFELTEITSIGLTYDFTRLDYVQNFRTDRDVHSVALPYTRSFNDKRDSLTLRPLYAYRTSEDFKTDGYELQLGWVHISSELGRLSIFAGARYTKETRTDQENTNSSGFVAEVDYERKGESSTFRLGYRRNIDYNAFNQLVQVDVISARLTYRMTERFEVGAIASQYFTSNEQVNSNKRTRLFDFTPKLDYALTENYLLRLSYRFTQEYDNQRINDKNAIRNQVLLSLIASYPWHL